MTPRPFDELLAGFAALKPEDFDDRRPDADGMERLDALTDELLALPAPQRGIRALFGVIENLADADLGSPGPLVHALERMRGHYEPELESIKRKPALLTVWMVNRILNAALAPAQRNMYLGLLQTAAGHAAASARTRTAARDFIAHQRGAT